ncbi:hypothetical protein BX600DRAFT_507560 [Xylariales sp. PMI_506]|nr:hypothetical protein BX600DRAFT_507560 [Xylariales sp. PMI_506]
MAEITFSHFGSSPKLSNNQIPSTIRPVASFETPSESSLDSPSTRYSGFSSSVNSNTSAASYYSPPQTQASNGPAGFLKASATTSALASPMTPSDFTLRASGTTADMLSSDDRQTGSSREASPQWDNTVGKAALGKTGRVINKLVSDNDTLKRELKIERIKSEEAKQAAKLMEDKMERTVSDYESRLLEASVTKTLLSRKERQVEHLQSTVELEKKRTSDAQQREQLWRQELEKGRQEATVQVEEAKSHAAMMEGRYTAISSHWKEQGDQVDRATAKVRKEIEVLVGERKRDDERINTLRDLCDQQDANIRDLQRQKDEISAQFEKYKQEQEELLKHIKESAREREEEQMRMIEESKDVLGQLRWALNVKKNVAGAK